VYAKYDEIVTIDIEATCWDNKEEQGDQIQDIIQVGVAILDVPTLKITRQGEMFVRPLRSSISQYCTNLTTITPQQVAKAPIFGDVCHWLKEQYCTIERPWASYGDFDRSLFQKQCDDMNVRYPFSRDHINVKPLATLYLGLNKSIGNFKVAEKMRVPFEGVQHTAMDDAVNVAKILAKIIERMRK